MTESTEIYRVLFTEGATTRMRDIHNDEVEGSTPGLLLETDGQQKLVVPTMLIHDQEWIGVGVRVQGVDEFGNVVVDGTVDRIAVTHTQGKNGPLEIAVMFL